MSSEIAISVKDLHKSFMLPKEKAAGLKQAVFNRFRGVKGYAEQKVLKGISFDIHKGDFFGIIGRNGSGKSTLLKLLAEIYEPDRGTITVNGGLTPFIELGVGFNPELTGRENIYLNGALLGFSNREIDAMYDEIVAFAELEDFMEQKLKNYSSGMQIRLAFSISIKAKNDIMLFDEVLAVGDEAFQRKCLEYFSNLKKAGQTIILVTHDMSVVERYCNKAILIEDGKLIIGDKPTKIARLYSDLLANDSNRTKTTGDGNGSRFGTGEMTIEKAKLTMSDDCKWVTINIRLKTNKRPGGSVAIAYTIKDAFGTSLFGNRHKYKNGASEVRIKFPNILSKGTYFVDLSIYLPDSNIYADCWIDAIKFTSRLETKYATPIVISDSSTFI